jgi:hypothetical protein
MATISKLEKLPLQQKSGFESLEKNSILDSISQEKDSNLERLQAEAEIGLEKALQCLATSMPIVLKYQAKTLRVPI